MDLKEVVRKATEIYGEEGEALALGIDSITNNPDKAWAVIKGEEWNNYYTDIDTYLELADALVCDEVLWEDAENNGDEEVLAIRKKLERVNSEEEAKEYLTNMLYGGWIVLEDCSLAILFDYDIMAMI